MDSTPTAQVGSLGAPSVSERVQRIMAECVSDLGYAMRGVSSWDQDRLIDWRERTYLSPEDMARLAEIENQVFG